MASWSETVLDEFWQGMTPEEFDRRGLVRRRARRRKDWTDSAFTILGGAIWAFVILTIVWGLMR